MLGWALTFLILALVAGYMGFFGLAGVAATHLSGADHAHPHPYPGTSYRSGDRQPFAVGRAVWLDGLQAGRVTGGNSAKCDGAKTLK
jgi:hypothetical protein